MKFLFKTLLILGLLLVGNRCFAVLPELKDTACDSASVTAEFKDSWALWQKANTTLFHQDYSIPANVKASQEAINELRQSLAFLESHYKPESRYARPILSCYFPSYKTGCRLTT